MPGDRATTTRCGRWWKSRRVASPSPFSDKNGRAKKVREGPLNAWLAEQVKI